MTAGIRVIWPPSYCQHGEKISGYHEIEYFYGIDVDCLDDLPKLKFTRVRAVGQEDNLEFEYVINTRVEGNPSDGVRLVVYYDRKRNAEEGYDSRNTDAGVEVVPGTNTIVLHQGKRTGDCAWLPDEWLPDGEPLEGVIWEALDAPRISDGEAELRRREAGFRNEILTCDRARCVLTEETTEKALDAAHLIPANMGGPDISCNGIALRADLHRLFDAGLFTFAKDGRVVDIAPGLSEYYRQLLEDCDRLPPPTRERVRVTLASRPFQRRGDPAGC